METIGAIIIGWILGAILILTLIVCGLILVIRAICNYLAKQIAREIRKNNGELARAIAYELKRTSEQDYTETNLCASQSEG